MLKRLPICAEVSLQIIRREELTLRIRLPDKVHQAVHKIIRRPIQGQEPIHRQLITAGQPVNTQGHNPPAILEVMLAVVIQGHKAQAVQEL